MYNRYMKIFAYLALGIFLIFSGFFLLAPEQRPAEGIKKADIESEARVIIGNHTFYVSLADTPDERIKGLSGVSSLRKDEGMLFVFKEQGLHGFWMKDMLVALDILWIGADKRVVHIEESVSPDSYPAVFTPLTPALYVLEVPAGSVKEKNIIIGDQVFILP